jgi:hypothetical protein
VVFAKKVVDFFATEIAHCSFVGKCTFTMCAWVFSTEKLKGEKRKKPEGKGRGGG